MSNMLIIIVNSLGIKYTFSKYVSELELHMKICKFTTTRFNINNNTNINKQGKI